MGNDMTENPYNPSVNEITAAAERMRGRPSLEDTERELTGVIGLIADAMRTLVPTLDWEPHRDRSRGACAAPYSETPGVSVHLQPRLARAAIPDDRWATALDTARMIAAEAGMTQLFVRVDRPGHHDVRLYAEDGREIFLLTGGNTVLDGNTGCRYTTEQLGR